MDLLTITYPLCVQCPILPCAPAATFVQTQRVDTATGGRPVVSVHHTISAVPQYVSSSEATAMHNGTKTLSITIKWVCAEKGGTAEVGGRSLCVPNVQGGCKDPMWDARG